MPSGLSITNVGSTQQFVVQDPVGSAYSGLYQASPENGQVAEVAPGGNRYTFIVTATGAGTTFIDVKGADGSVGRIPVTVTNSGTVINGKAPR